MSDEIGTIYLLHFERPFKHARHYLGWTRNIEARMRHHEAGTGANLLRHVAAAGISWELVWSIEGDRTEERRLKGHSSSRYCPVCLSLASEPEHARATTSLSLIFSPPPAP